jgi:hypothetical protein
MASERKPGSDRGRSSIDWQQAFQYYASLPAERRDYREVAEHFGVSVRTVERHGQKEGWRQRAYEIDREAAASAAAKLVHERAAKLADVDRLIDGSYVSYARQLREGRVRLTAADLPRLHKLRRELWDDQASEEPVSPPPPAVAREDEAAHKLAVLRALRDAGALEQLQRLAGAEESEGPE